MAKAETEHVFRQVGLAVEEVRRLLTGRTDHKEPHVSDGAILRTLKQHNSVLSSTRRDVNQHDTELKLVQEESRQLRAFLRRARQTIELQSAGLNEIGGRLSTAERTIETLKGQISGLDDLEKMISNHNVQISTLREKANAMDMRSSRRFEANEQSLSTVEFRLGTAEVIASRLEGRIDRLKEELLLPAHNVTLPADLHAEANLTEETMVTEDQRSHLTHLLGVFRDQLETHEATVENHNKQLAEHTEAIKGKAKVAIEKAVWCHASRLDTLQEKMDADSECDIPTMLADLRGAEMQLKIILGQLKSKVTYDDLSSNIEARYAEILAYLQSTLQATEGDDGDLRQETKILRHALNEMRMTKADRGDLAQLRAQIASHDSSAKEAAEIEAIKDELELRPKRSDVCKMLSSKVSFADLKLSPKLGASSGSSTEAGCGHKGQMAKAKQHLDTQMPNRACATACKYPDWKRSNSESPCPAPFQQCLSCEAVLEKKICKSTDVDVGLPNPHRRATNQRHIDNYRPLYVSALPPPSLPRLPTSDRD